MECKCGNKIFYVKAVDISEDFDAESMDHDSLVEKIQDGDYEVDFCNSEVSVICKKCDALIYA